MDYNVAPGTEADKADSDQRPQIRSKLLDADILLLSTPTWVGHASSVAQRVIERLDAELSNKDEQGRPAMLGKVAIVAAVSNGDGAHKIAAAMFQSLTDIGYTIPVQGFTYWNGLAMNSTDYKELDEVPEATASTNAMVARNAAHLARALRQSQYRSLSDARL